MAILQKAGRWLAGRTQGTKGTKKYDTWMQKNPWARTALGAGDLALMFYGPGMVGKGLQKLGGAGKLAGTAFGRGAMSAGNFLAGAAPVMGGAPGSQFQVLPRGAGAMQRAAGAFGRGAQAVGRYAMANPEVVGAGLQALPALSQQSAAAEQTRAINQMAMEQQRRRQEIMDLLRPLFVQLSQGR